MEIWAKIEKNTVIYPPKNDKSKGMFNVDKNEKWLTENGFQLYDTSELQKYQPTIEEEPKKYSTLKIIRNLGADWEGYREQLSDAGVLDQFFAATYIASDDPVFLEFIKQVPEDYLVRLDSECVWTAD